MSRGDRGEVTRPGGVGAVLQSVLSDLFSAARVRGTLACLRVLPSELALGPGTKQAVPRSSGPRAGFLGPVHSAQVWLGPGAAGGSSFPHQFLPCSYPRFLGPGEEDSNGVQVLCFLLKLPGKTLEAAEGRPAGRGVAGCVEGRGKHHWPSASGIETDGRGEQYYHSKDPMGAIQQIPY